MPFIGAGFIRRERGKPRARCRHNNRGDGAHLNVRAVWQL